MSWANSYTGIVGVQLISPHIRIQSKENQKEGETDFTTNSKKPDAQG